MSGGYPNPPHIINWENIMLEHIQRLLRRDEETGASAVEYGLLVAAIAALIVIIVFALGGVVEGGLLQHLRHHRV